MKRTPRNQAKKQVANRQAAQKRVSNRKYPQRECLKTDCKIIFEPIRKNQVFCCNQHRIDQNNDNAHAKEQQIRQLEKIYRHNEAVLKKLYIYMAKSNSKSISCDYLDIETYNHQFYTFKTLNENTREIIYWNYNYGLEIFDKNRKTFNVHFNKI
jgi:hypothetical protein